MDRLLELAGRIRECKHANQVNGVYMACLSYYTQGLIDHADLDVLQRLAAGKVKALELTTPPKEKLGKL